jgi:DNA-binding transcriptional regulator YdaS (Cro superfamily)
MDSPIDKAISAVGSLTELARRLHVDPQVVVNWRKRGIPVPQVLRVEAATVERGEDDQPVEGAQPKVLRHELRPDMPDLFPPPDTSSGQERRVAA